ncbi:MAG TPA: MOSC domain-containing protein [Thermoplasmata archaeon]|nr:MOSC domain-containing protein [Thermoplasmata archaeon]
MADPAPPSGHVRQINRKPERPAERGLPKEPVAEARLTERGVEGDFNRYRHEERRDDPGMALLIVPIETIRSFQHDGWPVRPGDLGENITSEGIPYDAFVPGRRFRLGGARIEISKACTPCDVLYSLPYVGRERGPEFVRTATGRRGWYARVLTPGPVRPGDAIEAEPSDAR